MTFQEPGEFVQEPDILTQPPIDTQPILAAAPARDRLKPWGFWATLGWCLLIGIVQIAVATVILLIFVLIEWRGDSSLDVSAYGLSLEKDGTFLSVYTLVGFPTAVLMVFIIITLRGWRLGDYLGTLRLPLKPTLFYLGLFALLLLLEEVFATLTHQTVGEEFVLGVMRSADSLLLLALAIVVAAPIAEEVLFRGFIFKSFANSWLGPMGAILLCSFAWAILHAQYNAFYMVVIFIGGIILGMARHRTGSILIPIVLHFAMNLVATVQGVIILNSVQQ